MPECTEVMEYGVQWRMIKRAGRVPVSNLLYKDEVGISWEWEFPYDAETSVEEDLEKAKRDVPARVETYKASEMWDILSNLREMRVKMVVNVTDARVCIRTRGDRHLIWDSVHGFRKASPLRDVFLIPVTTSWGEEETWNRYFETWGELHTFLSRWGRERSVTLFRR